ncbi:hypothetical protein TNCV_256631 [Trichonephila clavipes]|nr:hypothetical protein TNCV_256631 [Trichonephila clavipes]
MPKTFEMGRKSGKGDIYSFTLSRSSLRFNKFIIPKTIEYDVLTMQASRKFLNIANIKSGPWSGQITFGFCRRGRYNQSKSVPLGHYCSWYASVGVKALQKCKLDASTILCTSLQGQKDTIMEQGEFSSHGII